MEQFYKISKQEADQIGTFIFSDSVFINAHVGEQVDGSFIISKNCIDIIKNHERVVGINFDSKNTYTLDDLNFKL
jgi:hypothetical protein